MVNSLNKVILIGNVGKEPEVRSTQDGREVLSFPLATSEAWKDKSTGEKKERTEWHRVVIFAQPLVNIAKSYVHKGSKIYIEGTIHTRKWTDQANVEKYSTEIVLQSYNSVMMLLDSKGSQASDSSYSNSGGGHKDPHHFDNDKQKVEYEIENLDDEIPF